MKALAKTVVVLGFISIISLAGCSSHQEAMKKKKGGNIVAEDNTPKSKVLRTVKRNDNKGVSLIKKQLKSNDLSSEKMASATIKPLTSIKDDAKSKEEAIEAKNNQKELQKIYFDYDRSDIRSEAKDTLVDNSAILKEKQSSDVLIEGHCDERGTEEYNLALGLKRAESVKSYLVSLGISDSNMSTISYGEASPEALGTDEGAWQQNRRAVLKEIND